MRRQTTSGKTIIRLTANDLYSSFLAALRESPVKYRAAVRKMKERLKFTDNKWQALMHRMKLNNSRITLGQLIDIGDTIGYEVTVTFTKANGYDKYLTAAERKLERQRIEREIAEMMGDIHQEAENVQDV